ncbi:nitroreductase family protein [Paenibacillus sp. IB182496]|uniref:Nitroreductase family protein n=1 Tax=Paenibacillus sabuli TaxID=2772509 RepID=A0A927BYS0_9BACL|nr:nitroreductase family protein [Paenibacillus sabuli]MBD2847969.1 nitroreductase family protein [Paenibacillus sabuli]
MLPSDKDEPLSSEAVKHRPTDYDINPLILNRWSPRAFADRAVAERDLHAILEAARWAPSSSNLQPWRFIVAASEEQKARFHSFINDGNLIWCKHAPVLLLVVSKTTNNKGGMNRSHAFDAGAAWGYLALEACRRGMIAHAMGGFNADQAQHELSIPNQYAALAVVAVGYQGDPAMLQGQLREREHPSSRMPLNDIIIEGSFA